jgi:hypothetical protein
LNLILIPTNSLLVLDSLCRGKSRKAYTVGCGQIDISQNIAIAFVFWRGTEKDAKFFIGISDEVLSRLVTLKTADVAYIVSISGGKTRVS